MKKQENPANFENKFGRARGDYERIKENAFIGIPYQK